MARPRVVVNLIVAGIVALVAGMLVLKLLRSRQAPDTTAVKGPPEIKIAVAAAPLSRGARLDADKLKLSPYFEQSIPEGAFRGLDELRGRVVSQPMATGEPVTREKLFPEGVTGGLEAMITPGKRAMAVKGTPVLGLGGLIGPGAHIDIYGVYGIAKDDKAAREIPVSKLIMQNIPVLAVGEDTDKKGAGKTSTDLYTLEVTPDEAEKLALASDKGTLHFTLRNPADDDVVFTQGKDLLRLVISYLDFEAKQPDTSKSGPPQDAGGGVVIVKGVNVELVGPASAGKKGQGKAQGQAQAQPQPQAEPVPDMGAIPAPSRK